MLSKTSLFYGVAALAVGAVPAMVAAAPPPPTNSSLETLTVSQTFPAWQSTVKYQVPTSGPNAGKPQGYGNYAKVTASIRYDAATQSYTVRDTGSISNTSTFGPSNKVGAESDARFTVYRKSAGGTTETLRMLNPGASNPLIALTYTSYGAWRTTTSGASATSVNDTYFVYGIKTPAANMPRTGSASYTTVLDGSFQNSTASYAVSGTGTLGANFGAGTVSYSATAVGTPSSGPLLNFGTLSGTGKISFSGSSFTGNPDASNPTYKMSLSGYFFGPAAQEVGATFRLSGGNGNGNGVMVGHQ